MLKSSHPCSGVDSDPGPVAHDSLPMVSPAQLHHAPGSIQERLGMGLTELECMPREEVTAVVSHRFVPPNRRGADNT